MASTPLVTAAAAPAAPAAASAAPAPAPRPAAVYYPPRPNTSGSGGGSGSGSATTVPAVAAIKVARQQPPNQLIRNLKYHDSNPSSPVSTPKAAAAADADAPAPVVSGATGGKHTKKLQVTGHDYHALDIYLPTFADDGKAPVLIHVHGGGWQRGDRTSEWRGAPVMGRTASAHGFVCVVVSYRLAPPTLGVIAMRSLLLGFLLSLLLLTVPASSLPRFGVADSDEHVAGRRWGLIALVCAAIALCVGALMWWKTARDVSKARHPHQVTDVARAISWVQKHLHTHVPAADLDAVFVSGHSAGAHLASLVTLDTSYMRDAGVRDADTFVKGCIPMSGIYTVSHPMRCRLTNAMFRFLYMESAFGTDPAVWVNASPITHVTERVRMPFCVMNASADVGLDEDGRRFVAKLKECGVPVEYHVLSGTDHASIAARFDRHNAHVLYFQFVRRRVAELKALANALVTAAAPGATTTTTTTTTTASARADPTAESGRIAVASAGAVAAVTDVDIKLDEPAAATVVAAVTGTGAAAV